MVSSRKGEGRVPLEKLDITNGRMSQKTYERFEGNVATFENEAFGDGSEAETDADWSD